MPTLPPFVYPGLAGSGSRPYGTLIVGDVPKPTGPFKPPKAPGAAAPKPPTLPAPSFAPSAPSAPSPQRFDPNAYNLDVDPVVAEIHAANLASAQQRQAAALEGKRGLLAAFGSQEIARKLLGADDPTVAQISDNPDTSLSTLARIGRSYRDQGKATDESLNKSNLFYSGTRVKALSDLAYAKNRDVNDATSALNDRLAQIDQALTSSAEADRQREIQARNDALNRAVQFASQYGIDPGGPDNPDTGLSALQRAGLDIASAPTWQQIQRQLGLA